MSTPGVVIGHNSVIRIGRGSGPTWTTLTGTQDFEEPDQPRAEVDVTSMDSPGNTEEFILGMQSAPSWSVSKHYVENDPEDVLLRAVKSTGETIIVEITTNGSLTSKKWLGKVTNWRASSIPVRTAIMGTLTVKIMAQVV